MPQKSREKNHCLASVVASYYSTPNDQNAELDREIFCQQLLRNNNCTVGYIAALRSVRLPAHIVVYGK
jgi:hypothetical protein